MIVCAALNFFQIAYSKMTSSMFIVTLLHIYPGDVMQWTGFLEYIRSLK